MTGICRDHVQHESEGKQTSKRKNNKPRKQSSRNDYYGGNEVLMYDVYNIGVSEHNKRYEEAEEYKFEKGERK